MSLTIFPTFFPDFRCKAGACRHTCCQTWEIDIDEDTKDYYQTLKSPLCQELRQWMGTSEDGSTCFTLNEKGYCHFLNKAGLCRLVLELGEDALCDICREHPRFYKYPCGAELSGTGLCCERTVEEIAGHLPLTFELLDPEAAEQKPMTVTFSQLMDELLLPLSEEECHFPLDLSPKAVSAMLDAMADTEPIDAAWTKDLSWMQACAEDLVDKAKAHPPKVPRDSGMPSTSTSSIASWTLRAPRTGISPPFPSPYSPGLPQKVRSSSTSRPCAQATPSAPSPAGQSRSSTIRIIGEIRSRS